jgi:hypothetical protein
MRRADLFLISERIPMMQGFISIRGMVAIGGLAAVSLAIGCARPADTASCADSACDHAACAAHKVHTHDGWWCDEHGVPEEVCAQCNPKLAAEFQKRGDWCADHDRPDSQCFFCHPELKAKFAARYEAKLGTLPPEPTL